MLLHLAAKQPLAVADVHARHSGILHHVSDASLATGGATLKQKSQLRFLKSP